MEAAKVPHSAIAPRIGRGLMWFAAFEAVGASVAALSDVLKADGSVLVVETWRMYGLMLCAALFVLLALRPGVHGAVWGVVVANKAALTITCVAYAIHGGVDEATTIVGWDGSLTVVLVVAYLLCRRRGD
ncbi:hypothetical protein GCM10029978_073790 [Actinoallomurus acanthiterrae]